jgi:hypothetical protein
MLNDMADLVNLTGCEVTVCGLTWQKPQPGQPVLGQDLYPRPTEYKTGVMTPDATVSEQ